MHWLRRCIGMFGLACIAGIVFSASVAAPTESNGAASLTKTILIEDSVAGLLPNPAQYDSALEYAESEERTEFLGELATHTGKIMARSLASGELGETTRYDHKGKTLSTGSSYTGGGGLYTVDDRTFVEGKFVDGEIDPASVRWLKVGGHGGQAALFHAPEDGSYWNTSYAENAEGAVGLTSTSLIVAAEGTTSYDVRDLDASAIIGMIVMLDGQLPGWRSLP